MSESSSVSNHRLAQKRGIWQFSGGIGSILLDYQGRYELVTRLSAGTYNVKAGDIRCRKGGVANDS